MEGKGGTAYVCRQAGRPGVRRAETCRHERGRTGVRGARGQYLARHNGAITRHFLQARQTDKVEFFFFFFFFCWEDRRGWKDEKDLKR